MSTTPRAIRLSSFLTALALIWGAAPIGHETRAAAQSGPTGLAGENVVTVPNIISTDTTWTADNTYLIVENTVVVQGATLTIEPGTTVRYADVPARDHALEIRGSIVAEGTQDEPIVFTSSDGKTDGTLMLTALLNGFEAPIFVAIGDADNDGDNELLVAESNSEHVSVIRWNGTGFDEAIRIPIPESTSTILITDADNDGANEIVTFDNDQSNRGVSIISWNGSSLGSIERVPLNLRPFDIAIGDPDNDGDNDIVLAGETPGWVRWNGAGFDLEVALPVAGTMDGVSVGDVNTDGRDDIVFASKHSNEVSVLVWAGAGFAPEIRLPTGDFPADVIVADADNKGINDIITANSSSQDLSLIRWNGTEFSPRIRHPATGNPIAVVVGDVDHDGDNDMISANMGTGEVSLILWNGTNFQFERRFSVGGTLPISVAIGDIDGDGLEDLATANQGSDDISILSWTNEIAPNRRHGGIKIVSTAARADFKHCLIQFGSVTDNSLIATFSDCTFDRAGGAWALNTPLGSGDLIRCKAIGNGAGGGINAGSKTLVECIAELNSGRGLEGGRIVRCVARDNGEVGIFASISVIDSVAEKNGSWGILSDRDISGSTSRLNRKGMSGRNIRLARVEANEDLAVEAHSIIDSIVINNGEGLILDASVSGSYIAENGGSVLAGGIESSVILGSAAYGGEDITTVVNSWIVRNSLGGLDASRSIENSAILDNGGVGILGKMSPPFTAISGSTIKGNAGSGVSRAGPVLSSSLFDNGWTSGFDYQETRTSDQLLQTDLSGNYWGAETTLIMIDHPWGTFFDIPAILDFVDDTKLTEVRYENPLLSAPDSGPDLTPPGFLLGVTPNLREPPRFTEVNFLLTFSEPMNNSIEIDVSFGLLAPFRAVEVIAHPGWIKPNLWRGRADLTLAEGDGVLRIRVSGATDASGFEIPNDTSNRFELNLDSLSLNSASRWEIYE